MSRRHFAARRRAASAIAFACRDDMSSSSGQIRRCSIIAACLRAMRLAPVTILPRCHYCYSDITMIFCRRQRAARRQRARERSCALSDDSARRLRRAARSVCAALYAAIMFMRARSAAAQPPCARRYALLICGAALRCLPRDAMRHVTFTLPAAAFMREMPPCASFDIASHDATRHHYAVTHAARPRVCARMSTVAPRYASRFIIREEKSLRAARMRNEWSAHECCALCVPMPPARGGAQSVLSLHARALRATL